MYMYYSVVIGASGGGTMYVNSPVGLFPGELHALLCQHC